MELRTLKELEMANREACELYIEQQIEEALEEGKAPYSIGKEISSMIERIFETKIPPKTLAKRAERKKNGIATNVANKPTNGINEEKTCDKCDKLAPHEIAGAVEKRLPKDGSISEAARKVAEQTGRPESSIRRTYQREKQKEVASPNYDHDLIRGQFERSFEEFRKSILNAKALKWQTTSREVVLEKLEELFQLTN